MSTREAQPGFLSIGRGRVRDSVLRASVSGRLQRTALVHGPRGAGKGAFVDDLLALLLCRAEVPDQRPCNACRGCRDARRRTHPDLVIASPDRWREERSTGESIVAVARRWLLESSGAPIAGERRILLIEEIDRANEQIQNALLKALEEPADRQMFVLVTDDLGAVLPTIRSRAELLRVGAVPRTELVAWLVDNESLPADQADLLARLAAGLPGRAIGYARDPQLVEWRRRMHAELLSLLTRGRAARFGSVRELIEQPAPAMAGETVAHPIGAEDGARPSGAAQRSTALAIVDAWGSLGRDLLVTAAGRPAIAPAAQLFPELAEAAASVSPAEIRTFLVLLERIRDGLRQNAAPRLALEVAALAWPAARAPRAAHA